MVKGPGSDGAGRRHGPTALGEDVPQVPGGEKMFGCHSAAKGSGNNTSRHPSHFLLLVKGCKLVPQISWGKGEVTALVTGERQAWSLADIQVTKGVGQ